MSGARRWMLGVLAFAGFAASLPHAFATGYYGTNQYLDAGGSHADATPEFYWSLEVERLAKGFKPPEKMSKPKAIPTIQPQPDDESTPNADLADFKAALKAGKIKPPDPDLASKQHEGARAFIVESGKGADPLPEEFASEFADYHQGALAYQRENWEQAEEAWRRLLARPEAQRHYRSVWAAFMMGKAALKRKAYAEAAKHFELTRKLAREGFADSLEMAAASYGWEGRAELRQEHFEKAARLYLTQLALGDRSAVVSLKAVIPDREPIYGMLNFGPEPDERSAWTEKEKRAADAKALARLKKAAKDPLLRRLVTVHILATESAASFYEETPNRAHERCARWLTVLKAEKLGAMEDAEYLGWVAYTNGNYEQAGSWLKMAKADSPAAHWLEAKLLRRAGKLDQAIEAMRLAWDRVKPSESGSASEYEEHDESFGTELSFSVPQSAAGDLGAMYLSRSRFLPALDTLLKGGLWDDAAFVAERILTADELKTYVDALPKPPARPKTEDGNETQPSDPLHIADLRYLLGRRLVREDRYAEAAQYLPEDYAKKLGEYANALAEGGDTKLDKKVRAKAWFRAACIARADGMEIMGTEGAPDGFVSGGAFASPEIAKERSKAAYEKVSYSSNGDRLVKSVPMPLKPSKEELERLAKNRIAPEVRYHYRVIAAMLALKSAALLEDNTEELADVLNTAGGWIKNQDENEKLADRIFEQIRKRAAKSEIGRKVLAKRWFTDDAGPWTKE